MAKQQSDRSIRDGLRMVHAALAWSAIICGLPLALIGVSALGMQWFTHPHVRIGGALLVLLSLPALLADRLLPRDPEQRKPGLVRDVLAVCWAGAALLMIVLAPAHTGDALRAQAEQLQARGWSRAAWLGRWMAGPAPTSTPAQDDSTPASAAEPPIAAQPSPLPSSPTPTLAAVAPPADASTATEPAPTQPPTPAPTAEREYSPAELFATYAPAVVSIKIDHGGFHSGGTGFFIDEAGTIATNEHVIDGAHTVSIKLWDGTELERVELLASDPEVDLALLRVDPRALPRPPLPARLGDSEAVQVGEEVSVIGNPLGLDHTLSNGIVSARRVYEGERYIQMSAPISPGNSGGPVFDRHGRVIGVSVAQMIGGQNLNLAVPVSQLLSMIADEYPKRRSFGASSW